MARIDAALLSILTLIYHEVPSGRCMIGPKRILLQDNDPRHAARVIKNYLQPKKEQEVLKVMAWLSQSPDLNIMECVWDYTKRQQGARESTLQII